ARRGVFAGRRPGAVGRRRLHGAAAEFAGVAQGRKSRWAVNIIPQRPVRKDTVPPLCNGDSLTQAEFHRRYEASPEDLKAELIGGVVYMASPVGELHGVYQGDLGFLFNYYKRATPGVQMADNITTILGSESEPQPDLMLYISPESGGQTR